MAESIQGSKTPDCAARSIPAVSKQSKRDRDLEAEAKRRGMSPHLLAALKIAAGTAAYCGIAKQILAKGDVVRFENPPEGQPGHFKWSLESGSHPDPVVLDITKPAEEQPGVGGLPGTFRQSFFDDPFTTLTESKINSGDYHFNNEVMEGLFGDPGLADALDAGTVIGPDLPFAPDFSSVTTGIVYSYYGFPTSDIPENVRTYLGARWYVGDYSKVYYGWIGVERTGNFLDAFAWGYETTPNTPIVAGAAPQCPLPGCERKDIANGDCRIDLFDLAALLANYGLSGENLPGDIDLSGVVDLNDLALMLMAYGYVCE